MLSNAKLREQRTVKEVFDGMGVGAPGNGNWTVSIEEYPWPLGGFGVWAVHDQTGAVVPADGSRRTARALGKARVIAGQLATVLRGTMYQYDWKEGK